MNPVNLWPQGQVGGYCFIYSTKAQAIKLTLFPLSMFSGGYLFIGGCLVIRWVNSRLKAKTQHIGCLTYNFHILHDRIIQDLVSNKTLIITTLKKLFNITYSQQNMLKPSLIINSLSHRSRFCLFQQSWQQGGANCLPGLGQHPFPRLLPR